MTSIDLGPDDDGRDVRVHVDDRVVLKLPENPTTGYRWAFDRLEGPMEPSGDTYEPYAADAAAHAEGRGVGASTFRVLTLRVRGPGRARLRLKRRQEWEGDSSIDATFSCTIEVEDGEDAG